MYVLLLSLAALIVTFANAAHKCTYTDEDYRLDWTVNSDDQVDFELTFSNFPPGNRWTGVAFGRSMGEGLDAILVKSINGVVSVTDESVQGYSPAVKDEEQDVMLKNSSIDGSAGTLTASFSRPLKAAHKHSDRSISGCRMWQFITSANPLDESGNTNKHFTTPQSEEVCMDRCYKRRRF